MAFLNHRKRSESSAVMKVFIRMPIVFGFLILAGHSAAKAAEPAQTRDVKKADRAKEITVTILIVSYDRRDKSDLPDRLYLPKLIKPALAQLKDKGAKKIKLNIEKGQLYIWLEGMKVATFKDTQAAFPGLRLKAVAEAIF
jgi:hypothetical protein